MRFRSLDSSQLPLRTPAGDEVVSGVGRRGGTKMSVGGNVAVCYVGISYRTACRHFHENAWIVKLSVKFLMSSSMCPSPTSCKLSAPGCCVRILFRGWY